MTDIYQEFIRDYPVYADDPMIKKAFDMAIKAHEGQLRHSGDPYITHPYAVVRILADLGLDSLTIVVGILHDVIEDTDVTLPDIEREFSPEVAKMVDGLTKLKNMDFKTKEEQQAESLRKMLLAMATDIRVIIIKLADRLHNMRTLKYQSENKQKEKAQETFDIYAPLADRLGINTIKWELEDLSLKFLNPEAYFDIAEKLKNTRKERQEYIDKIIIRIREITEKLGINAEIEGRPKHIYSIYRKMKNKHKSFDELYDLIAVRIIVDTVKDCYGVLGAVHTLWRPIPMRFKDYIAVPKQNMYQSLHTTLLGDDGLPFEVQIRTHEMHSTAEYGIAAHWRYKEGTDTVNALDSKLAWLRELMEWQKDLSDSREFLETLKFDFFSDNVFVFTPKGDIKDFVKGATPLDFAYSIHSEVGNKCTGAKVNGKLVPLDYQLQTGDIVSIITSQSSKGPSRDWLKFVKTAQARGKIRQWFKKELKEENIVKGREMLEDAAKRMGYDLHLLLKPEWVETVFKRFTLHSMEDMYAAIGYGGIGTNQVLTRLVEQYKKENKIGPAEETPALSLKKTGKARNAEGITVKGEDGLVVRLAHCCNPVPGDKIIGYITRGRGVSVHRADCNNINDIDFEEGRRIEVEWAEEEASKYEVEIQVNANDRAGLLVEISQLLFALGHSLIAVNARTMKGNTCAISLKIEISNIDELEMIITKLKMIESVTDVFRVKSS